MTEYIEREKLIKKIDDCFSKTDPNGQEQIGVLKCRGIIREMPPADVLPVKRGKWVEYPRAHYFKCSQCKYTVPYKKAAILTNNQRAYKYCPKCGVKMDGEED